MPRQKQPQNIHYPIGFSERILRGKKRFRYRNNKRKDFLFPIETSKEEAIEAAEVFNKEYRNPSIKLLLNSEQNNSNNDKGKKLSHWIPIILKRVLEEELNEDVIVYHVYRTFELDMERLMKLHGDVFSKEFCLDHVNSHLDTYVLKLGKSYNVYNAKLSFLDKVFMYLMDLGASSKNYAKMKKKMPKPEKLKVRLGINEYNTILDAAPLWLQIAMRLSLQTTHAVNEISIAKYSDCIWYDEPVIENDLEVYGLIQIQRKKTIKHKASRVEIPITKKIKSIIEDSRKDNVASPYIIHQLKQRSGKLAKDINHPTQLRTATISEEFSKLRDELNLYENLSYEERPTFHEIRALAIFSYDEAGIDPQKRAAHSSPQTTAKYKKDHVKFIKVLAAEI
jgi:hypothetical protein